MVNEKTWLTPVEAAEYAGLSRPRMYAMIQSMVVKSKEIPPEEREHRGARILVEKDSIDTYLANVGNPRNGKSATSTKYTLPVAKIVVDNEELQQLLRIPIGDLLAAYKAVRIDRTVYTLREAARATKLEQKFITKMCDLGMIECLSDGKGNITIPEKEVTKLQQRTATA